jgi:putative ABC transport system permease protein
MIRNYLKIALRYMSRQRGFSLINISGLTIGIACSLLIILYIIDEVQFDTFHADNDRIYRVAFEGQLQGKSLQTTLTGFPVAKALREELPDIESTIRMARWATFPVRFQEKTFTERYLLLSDPNLFRFFSLKLIEGHPDSVLNGPRKIVMSESAAKRYFDYKGKGDLTPIGKTLELAQGYVAKVTGIAEDPPVNSHFHFSLILSLSSWEQSEATGWVSGKVITYFKTKTRVSDRELAANVNDLIRKKADQEIQQLRNLTPGEFNAQGNSLRYFIQPLRSIHLHSDLEEEIENNGSIEYIYLFGCIAVFITLLACINFMNLTTAQSASRAKEVAVRKAVGAHHNRLIAQFLLESYFYVFIAVILASSILLIALAPFNFFTGKELTISTLLQPAFLVGIILFVLITGLVAGSYPSFYLTHYSPVEVLKGNLRAKLRSYGIRNVLVVFQFMISAGLIIATLVVYQQLQFVQHANLGFDKQNLVNLLHTRNLGKDGKKFKDELLNNPEIIAASYCNRLPPNVDWQSVFRPEGVEKDFLLAVYEMDYDHLKTLGYPLADGRFFSTRYPDDSLKIILNQRAAEKLKLRDFEGKKIFSLYDQPNGRVREVIGILKDFNFQSLRDTIQPMAVVLGHEPNWEMAIRVKEGSLEKSVSIIEKLWKKYAPNAPFEYTLLEKNFSEKLKTERRIGFLFLVFTGLAIIIACLGLFGLAAFTADQHRKQIGIRKVMGATVGDLVGMLNRDFMKLVLIANLLAWPLTWLIMNRWLDQFAYHIVIPWWIFMLAGTITVLIAFLSVSFQAFKAASGNPVNSLRNE